jgi:hypothetical protein
MSYERRAASVDLFLAQRNQGENFDLKAGRYKIKAGCARKSNFNNGI